MKLNRENRTKHVMLEEVGKKKKDLAPDMLNAFRGLSQQQNGKSAAKKQGDLGE